MLTFNVVLFTLRALEKDKGNLQQAEIYFKVGFALLSFHYLLILIADISVLVFLSRGMEIRKGMDHLAENGTLDIALKKVNHFSCFSPPLSLRNSLF